MSSVEIKSRPERDSTAVLTPVGLRGDNSTLTAGHALTLGGGAHGTAPCEESTCAFRGHVCHDLGRVICLHGRKCLDSLNCKSSLRRRQYTMPGIRRGVGTTVAGFS